MKGNLLKQKMLFFTKDHIHDYIMELTKVKNRTFILPSKMDLHIENLEEGDLILHISNPISDSIYNIEKYIDIPHLVIYDPRGGKSRGFWKQQILGLLKAAGKGSGINSLENLLNEPEYIVKYIYFFLGKSAPTSGTNVDYNDLIRNVSNILARTQPNTVF